MTKIPVAVQMFTLREETEKDFAGTLKKVAELGFDGVEFAGYGGLEVTEVKALLDEYGLKASGSHVPFDQLQNNLEQVIEEQKILGSEYIVWPYLTGEQRNEETYKSLIPTFAEIGKKVREAGMTFCYHNHDFELDKLSDGRFVLQAFLEDTDPAHVQAELDVYWIKRAGEDPVEWIQRYKDRTPLIHLKDMTTDDEQFFAELGTGGVDIDAVIKAGQEVGAKWFVVEQDQTRRTPFESIEISINYLKTKLPYLADK